MFRVPLRFRQEHAVLGAARSDTFSAVGGLNLIGARAPAVAPDRDARLGSKSLRGGSPAKPSMSPPGSNAGKSLAA
jgi:hypothetical protein